MSKPWEMRLSKERIRDFTDVLNDLKKNKRSSICPLKPWTCDRSEPNCGDFVKGLKRKDGLFTNICPCFKFRTKSLIWRIEKLLSYNKQLRSNSE